MSLSRAVACLSSFHVVVPLRVALFFCFFLSTAFGGLSSPLFRSRLEFLPGLSLPEPRTHFCLLELSSTEIFLFGGKHNSSSASLSDIWLLGRQSDSEQSWSWRYRGKHSESESDFSGWWNPACWTWRMDLSTSFILIGFGVVDSLPTNRIDSIEVSDVTSAATSLQTWTTISDDADVVEISPGRWDRPPRVRGASLSFCSQIRSDDDSDDATDSDCQMYLFGGYVGLSGPVLEGHRGVVNDLFRGAVDVSRRSGYSMVWDHVSGSAEVNPVGKYGVKGDPSPTSIPEGRYDAAVWGYGAGVYVFGGRSSRDVIGAFNDLWKFHGLRRIWVWLSGEKGVGVHDSVSVSDLVFGATNVPSSRFLSYFWKEGTSGYLVGGAGNQLDPLGSRIEFADVWQFFEPTQEWRLLRSLTEASLPEFGFGGAVASSMLFFGHTNHDTSLSSNDVWPFIGFSCWSHFHADDASCGRGTCVAPDECVCNSGFSGERCTVDSRFSYVDTLTIGLGTGVGILLCAILVAVVVICYTHVARKASERHVALRDEGEDDIDLELDEISRSDRSLEEMGEEGEIVWVVESEGEEYPEGGEWQGQVDSHVEYLEEVQEDFGHDEQVQEYFDRDGDREQQDYLDSSTLEGRQEYSDGGEDEQEFSDGGEEAQEYYEEEEGQPEWVVYEEDY